MLNVPCRDKGRFPLTDVPDCFDPPPASTRPATPAANASPTADTGNPARPSNTAPRRPATPAPQRHATPTFRNPFLAELYEMRHELAPLYQRAISHLKKYDDLSAIGPTNADLISPFERMDPDPGTRFALRRKASFLLIKDVLTDIKDAVEDKFTNGTKAPIPCGDRLLRTAQASALKQQVEAEKITLHEKIMAGERIFPFTMDMARFPYFMQSQQEAFHMLRNSCALVGEERPKLLSAWLEHLANAYLAMTNRLPEGISGAERVTYGDVTFWDCKVGVYVTEKQNSCTFLEEHYGKILGIILINPEGCTDPHFDPADGSDIERHFARDFSHCPLPEKQAAVFMQKLFLELSDLEERIGITHGGLAPNPGEVRVARAAKLEYLYAGSDRIGDQHDEAGTPRFDQRIDLIKDGPLRLQPLAIAYEEAHQQPLLSDPELNDWLKSPQFKLEMNGLHLPRYHGWLLQSERFKQALLTTPLFAKRPARY